MPAINFGNVVAGNTTSVNTEVKFSCQADNEGRTEYLNVCLSSVDAPPFEMISPGDQEGKQYTLLFRLLNGAARSQELGPASSGNLIQQTLAAQSNANVSGTFPLIATIPAGQSQLPAYHYYNYNMNLRIAWHSALRQDALQNCSDGSAEGEQVQGGTSAQAEISQGCYIERVTPLNFGTLTSTATLRPTRCLSLPYRKRALCSARTLRSLRWRRLHRPPKRRNLHGAFALNGCSAARSRWSSLRYASGSR